ncbi:MAG: glycosyltransferase 87 family protein [Desulfuromonadaceae bacterium]
MAFAFAQSELKRTIFSRFQVIVIFTSCSILALNEELRAVIPLLVGTSAVMTIALVCTLNFGERGEISWSPRVILLVALLLRLLFLFSPPQLSDDLYRYLWDGSNLISGTNPYAAAPAVIAPSPELAPVHSRINHPDYVTIYPPMAQIIFAGGAASGGSIIGLKTFLVMIDIGLCALILMILKRLELPAWKAVLYAWNPLPVLEIAGSGHVDGAGMALVLAALYLLIPDRKARSGSTPRCWPFILSGALLACAGLVKLLPFVFAPLLLLLIPSGKRRYFIAGIIGTVALLVIPFLPDLINIASSMKIYARNWEFAGFAFTTLRRITGSGALARLLLSASFLLVVCVTTYRLALRIKQAESSDTKAFMALNSCYAIALAFLLLTPTLQPWYALTLAAFLPFCAGPAGLVLCWAVFLTYQVQIPYFILGQWLENPYVTAAVFMAPVTAWLLSKVFSNISRQDTSAHPL